MSSFKFLVIITSIQETNPSDQDYGLSGQVEPPSWKRSIRTRRRQNRADPSAVSEGLSEIANYGGYPVYNPPGNTDPWVRQSLKQFDPEIYRNIYGYTRRGAGLEGMYSALDKYKGKVAKFYDLNSDQQKAMRKAMAITAKRFKLPYKEEPLDWHEVGPYLRKDTSAGVSFMGSKKGEVMEDIYTSARWLGHRCKEGGKTNFDPTKVKFPPCLAGKRGHLSERSDPSTRLIWIYPAEQLVVEGLYAPRMYEKYEQSPVNPLLNGTTPNRLFGEWVSGLRPGEYLHGLDFSQFDKDNPPFMIRFAFDVIHSNIDWDNWRGKKVSNRDRQKWRNVWDAMVWYFINTPILMPDGRMFRKARGVPSGSWWTQLVDSIINYLTITYLSLMQNLDIRDLRVLGDDSAFLAPRAMDLDQAAVDCKPIQMLLNQLKSEIWLDPTQLKLLGTTYKNGRSTRPTIEWFKFALYPENPPRDIGISMSRLVGLWLGGAMYDKTFCKFFEFYQSGYPCPQSGMFSKDQRKWLSMTLGNSPRGWNSKQSLFWKSMILTL